MALHQHWVEDTILGAVVGFGVQEGTLGSPQGQSEEKKRSLK